MLCGLRMPPVYLADLGFLDPLQTPFGPCPTGLERAAWAGTTCSGRKRSPAVLTSTGQVHLLLPVLLDLIEPARSGSGAGLIRTRSLALRALVRRLRRPQRQQMLRAAAVTCRVTASASAVQAVAVTLCAPGVAWSSVRKVSIRAVR
jgi:hypothetical protein